VIDSGTEVLIYELPLITAIFGLDSVSKNGPMSNSEPPFLTVG